MVVAAIVAFVLLISVQAIRDWPGSGISGLGHDDSGVAVGPAHKAPPGVSNPVPAVHRGVSPAPVARTAAPPTSVPGHRGARSHHPGTAVDAAVGRGGVSRGSKISGTPARGGPPVATPIAPPAEPAAAPSSPAQPGNGNGNGHGAAHTKATSAGGSAPSSSTGSGDSQENGSSQGSGNSHGGGSHGASAKSVAPTPTPQAYSPPAPEPEAPPAQSAGEGDKSHGNAYGHENEYSSPGNSENEKSSGH
jgi:hypothetical protein